MGTNRRELNAKIRDAGFPLDAFTLFEEPREETLCMQAVGVGWVVFYSERGLLSNKKHFVTEDAACDYFLRELSSWFASSQNKILVSIRKSKGARWK